MAQQQREYMVSLNPTDADVLTVLADGRRQTRANIADLIDKDPDYLSQRLSALRTQDLITRVGPNEQSGLYEITPSGRAALHGSDTPGEEEVTRSSPSIPHLSPTAFTILEYLKEELTVPSTELTETLDIKPLFLNYLLDGLIYQHLIEEIELTITMAHDNIDVRETTQPGYKITKRGHRVASHRPDWDHGGDPALTEARLV